MKIYQILINVEDIINIIVYILYGLRIIYIWVQRLITLIDRNAIKYITQFSKC